MPGSIWIKAYIDVTKPIPFYPYDITGDADYDDNDGFTLVLMTNPSLTAEVATEEIYEGDALTISGNATGGTPAVDIILLGQKGYDGTGLTDVRSGFVMTSTATTTGGEFEEDITMPAGLDRGTWIALVLTPGRDGSYGDLVDCGGYPIGAGDIASGDWPSINGKTQDQIIAILQSRTVEVAVSDDLLWLGSVMVRTAATANLTLDEDHMADIQVGTPLVVTGSTLRADGTLIGITVRGPVELIPQVTSVEGGRFTATFDTSAAVPGTYIVTADDADGHADDAIVNITAPVAAYFDTGEGTYPSISGAHNGTITFTRMYTYPCTGTGGHAEYVRLWGNGVDRSASWTGYSGDGHIITFDEPLVVEEGKTYNYTIITGSYPQIIHKHEHTTVDGSVITCTEFVDVNGKRHEGWIPAITLFN